MVHRVAPIWIITRPAFPKKKGTFCRMAHGDYCIMGCHNGRRRRPCKKRDKYISPRTQHFDAHVSMITVLRMSMLCSGRNVLIPFFTRRPQRILSYVLLLLVCTNKFLSCGMCTSPGFLRFIISMIIVYLLSWLSLPTRNFLLVYVPVCETV